MNTHNQTITGPTVLDIPPAQKLHITSNLPFLAVTIPRNNAGSRVIDEMLNSSTPTTSYTTSNLSHVDSVCVVSPYDGGSIPVHVKRVDFDDYPYTQKLYDTQATQVSTQAPRVSYTAPRASMQAPQVSTQAPRVSLRAPRVGCQALPAMRTFPALNMSRAEESSGSGNVFTDFWGKIPSWGHYMIYAVIAVLVIALLWWLWKKYGGKMGSSKGSSWSSGWSLPSFF